MASKSMIKLHNGVEVPRLGMGLSHHGGYSSAAVTAAIEAGVKLFDTAQRYGTEAPLSIDLARSGVPRESFFITTKLWPENYGSESTIKEFHSTLQRLGTDYVDLYLMHWPGGGEKLRQETWIAMESLLRQGLCRAIGVSNFLVEHITPLLANCSIRPHVNQIELNPWQYPNDLMALCRRENIIIEGYCPLAKGKKFNDNGLISIAQRRNITPAQALIQWSLSKDVVTIPKTTNPSRICENFVDVWNVKLTPEDVHEMDSWHCDLRVTWDPTGVP